MRQTGPGRRLAASRNTTSNTWLPALILVACDQGVENMVSPLPPDPQKFLHIAFTLKSGFFKQTDGAVVLRNTGCLDPVQGELAEDVANAHVEPGGHMSLAGEALAHPVADHAGVRRTAPDVADRQAADQLMVIAPEEEKRDRDAGGEFLRGTNDARAETAF